MKIFNKSSKLQEWYLFEFQGDVIGQENGDSLGLLKFADVIRNIYIFPSIT